MKKLMVVLMLLSMNSYSADINILKDMTDQCLAKLEVSNTSDPICQETFTYLGDNVTELVNTALELEYSERLRYKMILDYSIQTTKVWNNYK